MLQSLMRSAREAGLEEGLIRLDPEWAAVRNLLVARRVLLNHVLHLSAPRFRLVPSGPEGDVVLWVVVEGPQGRLAQLGVTSAMARAMGMAKAPRVPLADAVAATILSPVLPGLARFFDQPVSVRVVGAEDEGPTAQWPRLRVFFPQHRFSEPCRLNPVFVGALHSRALAAPHREAKAVGITLQVGQRLSLRVRSLVALKPGDVLLDASMPRGEACLFFERSAAQGSIALAHVDIERGMVRHVLARHAAAPSMNAAGPCVSADVVLGHLVASSRDLAALQPAQAIPGWEEVHWLAVPSLHVAGRPVASLSRTAVAGVPGFEVRPA